ncbi:MAG: 50S ribosomal protein L28 [Bacilli bacterium]|nr:50S ribosomal protein L28 [Bacilli bacterium]
MAKKVTNKKPLSGNRRSHALNATKHAFKTNLQTITINGKKVRMTAREIRTLNKIMN